jgi:hypothetical protein
LDIMNVKKKSKAAKIEAAKQSAKALRRAEIMALAAKREQDKIAREKAHADQVDRWKAERGLGLSIKAIALNSGVARSTVYRALMPMAEELNLRRNVNHRAVVDYATMADWTRRYEDEGESCRQIADTTKFGTQFVWSKLRAAGCNMRERGRPAEKKPGAGEHRAVQVQGGNNPTTGRVPDSCDKKAAGSSETTSKCDPDGAARRCAAESAGMSASALSPAQLAERSPAARARWRKYRNTAAAGGAGALAGAAIGYPAGSRVGGAVAQRAVPPTSLDPDRLKKPVGRVLQNYLFDRHAKVNWARNVREDNIKRGFTKPLAAEQPDKPSFVGLYGRLLRRRLGSAPTERAKLITALARNETTWELSGDEERMMRRHLENLEAETGMQQSQIDRLYAAKPKLRGDRAGAVVTRKTAVWTVERKVKGKGGTDRATRMKAALAPGNDNKELMRQFIETPEGRALMAAGDKQAIERGFADHMKARADTAPAPGTIGAKSKIITVHGRVDAQFKRRGGKATLRASSIGSTEANNMRTELRNEANDIAQRAHDYINAHADRDLPQATADVLDRVARVRAARIASVVIPRGRRLGGIAGAAIGAIGVGGASALAAHYAGREKPNMTKFDETRHPRDAKGRFLSRRAVLRAYRAKLTQMRAEGRKPWYHGSETPVPKPDPQHGANEYYPAHAFFITRDRAIARWYGATTSRYDLGSDARILNAHTKLAATVARDDPEADGPLEILPKSARDRKLYNKWTRPFTGLATSQAKILAARGYHGIEAPQITRYDSIALHDVKPLKFLGAAHDKSEMQDFVADDLIDVLQHRRHKQFGKSSEPTDLAKASKKNQRKRKKHPLTEIADGAEAAIARGVAKSFAAMKDAVTTESVRNGGADLLDQIKPTDTMTGPISSAVVQGVSAQGMTGEPGGGAPRLLDFSMLARSPYVEQFGQRYAAEKITTITDAQRQAIQQILTDGTLAGTPPAVLARSIRDHIGLTPMQAAAVQNFRAKLETAPGDALTYALRDRRYDRTITKAKERKEPLSRLQIEQMTDAYQRRMLAYRATTIARTEAVGAANNGHMASVEAWLLANPEFTVAKTWIATEDEKTRPDHVALHHQVVIGIDTPFTAPSGEQLRWPHDPTGAAKEVVNCRCTVGTFLVHRRYATAIGPQGFESPIPSFYQQPSRQPFVADSPFA